MKVYIFYFVILEKINVQIQDGGHIFYNGRKNMKNKEKCDKTGVIFPHNLTAML